MKKFIIIALLLLITNIINAQSFNDYLSSYEPTIVENTREDPFLDYLRGNNVSTKSRLQSQSTQIITGYVKFNNKWNTTKVKVSTDDYGIYTVAIYKNSFGWCTTSKHYLKEINKYDKYFNMFNYKVTISLDTYYF